MILTLNALAAVYNIVIFYTLFKEKVSIVQGFGISLMLGCVALLSINGNNKVTES